MSYIRTYAYVHEVVTQKKKNVLESIVVVVLFFTSSTNRYGTSAIFSHTFF